MRKVNIYTAKEKKVNETYFTGNTTIREILGEQSSTEQEMYHVIFHAGARTTLHYHESEQILVATNGEGMVGLIEGTRVTDFEIDENDIIFLEKEGDTVCIPAYKLHFHGAIGSQQDKKDFSHIAIRKIHVSGKDGIIRKAENKWEYDLIVEETGIKNPHEIMSLAKGIAEKVQKAVSKKLETMQT